MGGGHSPPSPPSPHSQTSTTALMTTTPQQQATSPPSAPSSPGSSLSAIPVHVADFLFDNYVTRVAPQYPIHYTPDLVAMHAAIFHPDEDRPRGSIVTDIPKVYATYTLNLIMAISLSTAARSKQARANSIASGLFARAMEQLPGVLTNDLRGLQALVLLTQYTFLSPGVANFWLLTGFMSQACIDLGLHQEMPEPADEYGHSHSSLPWPLYQDLRRRVFWCAWEMEVAVCGALLRPITLLRRNVTTKFPSVLDDAAIGQAIEDAALTGDEPRLDEDSGRPAKFTSHYIWRYRAVECDIVPVLFHGEPLPASFKSMVGNGEDGDLAAWMDHQERTILEWKAEIHDRTARNTDTTVQSLWDEMQLYADIACDYILITLFRPCPRLRDPPTANLLKAFAAAVGVADGSWQQANRAFGSSKYVFHACYHSFSAAIAFLQALQRIKPAIAAAYPWAQVEANMQAFSRFFATVAERWPAASRCLDEYERLLAPVKRDYLDFLVQAAHAAQAEQDRAAQATAQAASESGIGTTGAFADIDLDEALTLSTFFNASALEPTDHSAQLYMGSGSNTGNGGSTNGFGHTHSSALSAFVAMDWNEEFSFGVDPGAWRV